MGILEKRHMEDWLALTMQSCFLTAACLTVRLYSCRVLEHSASLKEASQQAFLRLMLLKYNCMWIPPSVIEQKDSHLGPIWTELDTVKQMLHRVSANQEITHELFIVILKLVIPAFCRKCLLFFHQKMPSTAEISECTLSIVLLTAGQSSIFISLSTLVKKDWELKECSLLCWGWRGTVVCVLMCTLSQHTDSCFCSFQYSSAFKILEIFSNPSSYQ